MDPREGTQVRQSSNQSTAQQPRRGRRTGQRRIKEKVAKDLLTEDGARAAKRVFSMDTGDAVPNVGQFPSSQATAGNSQEAQLNFGVHRKGVLVAFDHRNKTTLEGKAKFTGRKTKIMRKLARLRNRKNVTETQVKRQRKVNAIENQPVVGIAHVEDLVHNDTNGGLTYYYEQCKRDPAFLSNHQFSLSISKCPDSPHLFIGDNRQFALISQLDRDYAIKSFFSPQRSLGLFKRSS